MGRDRCGLYLFRQIRIICLIGLVVSVIGVLIPVWSQDVPDEKVLLGQIHKSAGIECTRCHKEGPPSPVKSADCAGCHRNMDKVSPAEGDLPNPHNAHMYYPDCSDCHHVHKPSENQCAACHQFDFKMH